MDVVAAVVVVVVVVVVIIVAIGVVVLVVTVVGFAVVETVVLTLERSLVVEVPVFGSREDDCSSPAFSNSVSTLPDDDVVLTCGEKQS